MEPILEVDRLSVHFSQKEGRKIDALDGVSFCLYPGEILGIVGESGSGKSTMARALLQFERAAEGSIRLHGEEIIGRRGRALREIYGRMQMVFQSHAGSFDPRRTLGESVGESLRNQGLPGREADARARGLLAQCGLSADLANRYPGEVSGGQCQRAAIARALAPDPEILICDEATSALDAAVQRQIVDLIRSLRDKRGLSCLFICHNLALVHSFCDRVLVMEAGRIAEEGTPDAVLFSPRSKAAKALAEAALWGMGSSKISKKARNSS